MVIRDCSSYVCSSDLCPCDQPHHSRIDHQIPEQSSPVPEVALPVLAQQLADPGRAVDHEVAADDQHHFGAGRPTPERRPVPCRIGPGVERHRLVLNFFQRVPRSEEHTSELQSLMRISYAVFCLKKKTKQNEDKTKQLPTA